MSPDTCRPRPSTARCTSSVSATRTFTSASPMVCLLSPSRHGPNPKPVPDAIVAHTAAGDNGAPNVTLRRAPGRGRNFHGARRPSGMSLSNPVCARFRWNGYGGAGAGIYGIYVDGRTGDPHGDDRRRAGCFHQNTAAAKTNTRTTRGVKKALVVVREGSKLTKFYAHAPFEALQSRNPRLRIRLVCV